MNVAGLKCADLVDAMGRIHRHRCHILDLVSPTPGRILFGPAVTISYFPSCSASLDPDRYNLFYEAVGEETMRRSRCRRSSVCCSSSPLGRPSPPPHVSYKHLTLPTIS
jgi:4-hydroxy-4-methyl-2-oxoglutarate aldolase